MEPKHLLIAIIAIVIVAMSMYTCVTRSQQQADKLYEARRYDITAPVATPAPPPAPGARILIENYEVQAGDVDATQFTITFEVANTGQKPARNIAVQVWPWRGGQDNADNFLPANSPLHFQGAKDIIGGLGAGHRTKRTLSFTKDPTWNPATSPSQWEITFDEAK
jgi:hypothetical protein